MDPATRISLVRENLVLAVAFATAADRGIIGARFLPRDPGDETGGRSFDPSALLQVHDPGDLLRCVNNQVRCAFAFSALQANRALESLYGNSPIQDPDSDLQAARCILYLISRTVDADLMAPVWVCPPEYRRTFTVGPADFHLDAAALEGKEVCWDDFGGMDQYLALLEFCGNSVLTLSPDTRPGESPQDAGPGLVPAQPLTDIPQQPPIPAPKPSGGPPTPARPGPVEGRHAPADSVAAFVHSHCQAGDSEMTIAKDLYAAYQRFCREQDWPPLGQRSFGMRLTALGFERRRRGKGKHWWLGLSLNPSLAAVQPEVLEGV